MYCYGTAFHIEGHTLHRLVGATMTAPQLVAGTVTAKNPVGKIKIAIKNLILPKN